MENAWFEKKKENKTPNRGNISRSRSKTRNSNNRRDKSKSTERTAVPPINNENRNAISKIKDNREKYAQTELR